MVWRWIARGPHDPHSDPTGIRPPAFEWGIIHIEWRSWRHCWRKKWARWNLGKTPGSSWPFSSSQMCSWDERPVLKAIHAARAQLKKGGTNGS